MSSALVEQRGDEVLSVSLRRNGRVWPRGDTPSPSSSPIRELSDREIEPDLAALVERDLKARLPFREIVDKPGVSGTDVVAAYVSSLEMLQSFRHDAEFLIEAVCLSHIEFEQVTGPTDEEQRQQSEHALLQSMIERAELKLPVAANIATADLLAGPVDVLVARLGEALNQSVSIFTIALFGVFDRLVDVQLAGLFEWSGPGTCWYHFFKEIVRQENNRTTQRRSSREIPGVAEDGEEISILRTTTIDTTTGQDTLRIARHEHHVMDAFQTSLENSRVVIPLAVQGMIQAIPPWLAPFISVIDGTLFREQIISRDYSTSDWSQTRVSTVDQPILGCEPAVLIGHVVLAGWGPTEIAIELERRAAEERDQTAETGVKPVSDSPQASEFVSPLCHIGATVLMGAAFWVSPPWLIGSLLLSGAGLWWGVSSRNERQTRRNEQVTPILNTTRSVATLLNSATVQSLIVAAALWNGWVLLVAAGCGLAATVMHNLLDE